MFSILDSGGRRAKGAESVQVNKSSRLAVLTAVVDEQKGQKTYQKLETANKKEISYNEPSTRAQRSTLLSPRAWYS